ncbi:MAG: tRNA (adenosine(37)-N6)-threonylcarbamoyltransferase complex dimerization subunit type 1 TsaB [Mycobacteriales bacterium]
MLVLCLDTATAAVTAAIARVGPAGDPQVLAFEQHIDERRHGELLMPTVVSVLDRSGVDPRQVSAVAVGLGPGPYTSLRVGVVTAAAFAAAVGAPTYGACSLDLLAAEAGVPCVVVTDARRREVFWARYDAAGTRIDGPGVCAPASLADRLTAGDVLVGSGAARYRADLGYPLSPPEHASARYLAALVAPRLRAGAPSEVLVPSYLRRPDAVARQ